MRRFLVTILLSMFICTGCAGSSSEVAEPQVQEKITIETSEVCVVDDESTIAEDFRVFNLEMNVQNDELALSDVVVMFPTENGCYMYFTMPSDQDTYAYRINDITINDKTCELELLNVDGYYQKYKLPEFNMLQAENNLYQISTINFYNEKVKNDTQTYNILQNVTAVFDDEMFYFEQEYLYSITLQGQLFESIYQFNEENSQLVDLWSKVIGNIERLDEDRRSFFYFAFNCYDIKRDIHFIPEDILQLDVEFNRLSYKYAGDDKELATNIIPVKKKIEQSIKPETKYIVTDNKHSNKRAYKYDTINKLSEADLSKNSEKSNAKILEQAARQYDWAVQFGNSEGYPIKDNKAGILWGREYDISYTEIEDFKTIYIVYRYEGKTVSTGTNSLIKEITTEIVEEIPGEPTLTEEIDYDLMAVWQNEELSLGEKMLKSLDVVSSPFIPVAIGILIIIVIVKIGKSKIGYYLGRFLEKKVKEKLEEDE